MFEWIRRLFRRKPRTRRVEMRVTTWAEADRLIREEGWELAIPEEDINRTLGIVYVEKRELLQ